MNRFIVHSFKPRNPSLRSPSHRAGFSDKSPTNTPASRISRLEARLPRFLQRYVRPLRNAPISHVTAFVILHELTAIIPLFGLTAAFHYTNWLPAYFSEGAWVQQGVDKFGRYLRKKGWLATDDDGSNADWPEKGQGGVRIVLE